MLLLVQTTRPSLVLTAPESIRTGKDCATVRVSTSTRVENLDVYSLNKILVYKIFYFDLEQSKSANKHILNQMLVENKIETNTKMLT